MLQNELTVYEKLLDVSTVRHRTISHNIANLNTTDFKRKQVEFETLLDQENARADIISTNPKIVEIAQSDRIDDNSTVLETEMQNLLQNHLQHQTYLRSLSFKLSGIKGVIQGRF